jgi:hypothetical protein
VFLVLAVSASVKVLVSDDAVQLALLDQRKVPPMFDPVRFWVWLQQHQPTTVPVPVRAPRPPFSL